MNNKSQSNAPRPHNSLPWLLLTLCTITSAGLIYTYDNSLSHRERLAVQRGAQTVQRGALTVSRSVSTTTAPMRRFTARLWASLRSAR